MLSTEFYNVHQWNIDQERRMLHVKSHNIPNGDMPLEPLPTSSPTEQLLDLRKRMPLDAAANAKAEKKSSVRDSTVGLLSKLVRGVRNTIRH